MKCLNQLSFKKKYSTVAKNNVLNAEEPLKCSMPNFQSLVSTSSLKIVQPDTLLTNPKPILPTTSHVSHQPILSDLEPKKSAYMLHFSIGVEAKMMKKGVDEISIKPVHIQSRFSSSFVSPA